MVKNKILIFILLILSSCSSRLHLSTHGCKTNAIWHNVEREFSPSVGDRFAADIDVQKKYFDAVIVERIWTPLGQFSREKLLLSELLRLNGLNCRDIKQLEVSFYNDYVDVLTSFIPFLSSRTVMLKVIKN